MKKYIIRIIVFFVAVALIDIIFGKCFDYMYDHSKSGDARKINYAIKECNADVLIMGSSRAHHHYNPQILSDSLGLSCFNLGMDGSGVILMDGFYRLITQRYIPKYIIYDLTPLFDLYQYSADVNNTRYLAQLKPYYREDCLKQLYADVDGLERMKLYSGFYRYNTTCLHLFRSFFGHETFDGDGYLPLDEVMKDAKSVDSSTDNEIDTVKVKYLKQFIRDCKENKTQLIFVVSPRFGVTNSLWLQPGFDIISREGGCKILNYYCAYEFASNKEYFRDSFHMNREGADNFTKKIAHLIKKIIEN